MPRPFVLAHLSDVHLAPLPPFRPRHWNLKRALGYANWLRRRRHVHLRRIVDKLIGDLGKQAVDHVLVSGDLVNIGMPEEHAQALAWLEDLGDSDFVTVIPGNHDIYCPLWRDIGTGRWRPYMTGLPTDACDGDFPFLRRFADIALIGVNSAVPTAPGIASGEIGEAQLAQLDTLLAMLADEDVCRIVAVHHPPLAGQAKPARGLRDAEQLEAVLVRNRTDLVLHGHNHRNMTSFRTRADGQTFPIIGVPSFSVGKSHGGEPLGAYNLYAISAHERRFAIEMVQRGIASADGSVREIMRRELRAPATMDKQT